MIAILQLTTESTRTSSTQWPHVTLYDLSMTSSLVIPLDLKMFEFTGWSFEEGVSKKNHFFEEGSHHAPPAMAKPPAGMEYDVDDQDLDSPLPVELGVLKSFEFVSHLRRASVIVRKRGDPGAFVFVKGAPEVMKDICQESSIPSDYEDLLSYYTHRGYRVIACATRYIARLSSEKLEKMERTEAESRLQLTGFIIFENKLKEITSEVIEELNDANIRNVMCTGDNILTAISVARECNLISSDTHCFVPHFAIGDRLDPRAELVWESVDNSIYQLDSNTLTPSPQSAGTDTAGPYDAMNLGEYSLAVTGDVFRWIVDYGTEIVLHRMLVRGQVFARMSPDEKARAC